MHDQSPLIKSASEKNNFYRSQSTDKPSGAPAGTKSFKKILESEENDPGGQETVEGKQGNEGVEENQTATKDLPKESPLLHAQVAKSPFALVGSEHRQPTPAARKTTPEPAVVDTTDISTAPADNAEAPVVLNNDPFDTEIATLDPKLAVPPDAKSTPTPETTVPADNTHVIQGKLKEDNIDFATTKKLINTAEQSEMTLEKSREAQSSIKSVSHDDNFNAQFTREQPDLSYVNPLGIPAQQNLVTPAEVQTARPLTSANLQSLVEQLVKELSVITTGDKTETAITLNYPPQFDGVKITITQYGTASNEFNLKFENLTQEAQLLVNQQQNRADLMSNLEQKGYNVHIFVTTTYTESSPLTADANPTGRERQNSEDGEQRGNRDGRQKREEKQ